MTESVKVNLTKTLTGIRIMGAVAGALLFCAIAYGQIDDRMDRLELEQATFKGIMEERTRNTLKRVDAIYDIVKNWEKE